MPNLEVIGLTKRYAGTAAVEGFTHTFADGKITALLGPSGSGKSTTLGMLAGLVASDDGRILLDGSDITELPAEKRDFGLIFQNYALFPHLSVRENIAFGLRVRHVPASERKLRVEEMLQLLRIAQLGERPVHRISGGEQQRVALARALAFHPRILLMDEPLSALDAQLREELRGELSRLLNELAITTIYVTHDQVEAMSLGHEMIILNSGRIEQTGPPIEVYRQPANLFVANFLGQANVFPAVCARDGEATRVHLPFATVAAVFPRAPLGDCWVMIRPEDLEIVAEPDAHFSASLESSSFLGNCLRLSLRAGAHRITVETRNETQIDSNHPVFLRIKLGKLFFWSR